MKAVTVILAQGVVLRGPLLLKLTPGQAAPRAHALAPQKKKGLFLLDGGKETAFKAGETFLIDDTKKLSPLQFSWEEDEEEAAAPPVTSPAAAPAPGATPTTDETEATPS